MALRREQWLALARPAWVALFLLCVALYALSIPLQFGNLHVVCVTADNCNNNRVTQETVDQLNAAGISLDAFAAYIVALNTGLVLCFFGVGTLIFLSRRRDFAGLLISAALVLFGASFSNPLPLIAERYPSVSAPLLLLMIAGSALFTVFLLVFPDGRFVPRWTIYAVPFIVLRETLNTLNSDSPLGNIGLLFELALILGSQVYRYRRVSTPEQKRQTKWVLYGMSITAIGFGSINAAGLFVNFAGDLAAVGWMVIGTAIFLFISLIPISIGIAILRSRLWDIDVIIRRTLVYAVLTALLAFVYFGGVVLLQQGFRALTGQGSDLAIILSTLAIAALFMPLRSRVQSMIDRRFYRGKYDAQRVLAAFAETARDEVDLHMLSNELVAVVEETVQPENVSLWLARREEGRGTR